MADLLPASLKDVNFYKVTLILRGGKKLLLRSRVLVVVLAGPESDSCVVL